MGDSEKPFACPSPGCNMSFTNEDHLVVHKKKHDMVLNFGNNGKNTFVADQTPTPTRFIRNCEEVGLFQDLQNVNPFEETFRRAVEDGKTVALTESEVTTSTDDTLHTPHIFPNIVESGQEINEQKSSGDSLLDQGKDETKKTEIIVETKKSTVETSDLVVARQTFVAPKIDNSRIATNLSINGQEVQLLLKTADGKLMQLSAVPVAEERQTICQTPRLESAGVILKAENSFQAAKKNPESSDNRLTLVKMKLKQSLTKNGSTTVRASSQERPRERMTETTTTTTTDLKRKQDVLARNRASSMRARAKRKAWIQQLQKAATTANERNSVLQLEVKALKSEVAKLRALLLAHADCPVTKAMEKGATIVQRNVTTMENVVQNVDGETGVLSRRKKSCQGETPIAPKIPKLSMIHPAAILPRIESGKQALVLEDVPTIKILDVRTPNNETRKLVLLENPKRLEVLKEREFIRFNPTSLQVENSASKCTGT